MISNSVAHAAAVLLIAILSSAGAQNIGTYGECTTPNGNQAVCSQLEKCAVLYNKLLNWPVKEEDKVLLRRSQCGVINGKILVCCPNIHSAEQERQSTLQELLPKPGTCGGLLTYRILRGSIPKIDEFPWMALIEYVDNDGKKEFHCGGSLINSRYVLTAAHCIYSTDKRWTPISVRLGECDILTNPDCEEDVRGYKNCNEPHLDVPIERAIIHPDYAFESKNKLNDIGLLRLSRSVNYTEFIRPICLPINENLKEISFVGMNMDIAGWGCTEKGAKSHLKLTTMVPYVRLNSCRRVYSRLDVHLENSQMCAGGRKGDDLCKGDSGGALVALDLSNKSRVYHYIAGIASFAHSECGEKGWPGVYTKVSSYIDWITQNIQP